MRQFILAYLTAGMKAKTFSENGRRAKADPSRRLPTADSGAVEQQHSLSP